MLSIDITYIESKNKRMVKIHTNIACINAYNPWSNEQHQQNIHNIDTPATPLKGGEIKHT